MRIAFVKASGAGKGRVHVERRDGSEASWTFPSYGPEALPHDLVHFVCEVELGIRDGIYGRVAAGADLARINAQASRKGGKE